MKVLTAVSWSLLMLLGAVSGSGQMVPVPVVLPFTTSNDSLMLVSIMVDGQPKTLFFDTGAERTLVLARKEGVRVSTIAFTNSPLALQMPIAFVEFDRSPQATNPKKKIQAVAAYQKYDGVLGQDILRLFSRVCVDYGAKKIFLLPK